MPIIFAQSFIVVPGTAAAFFDVPLLRSVADLFQPQTWPYYLTYGLLILFFTYFVITSYSIHYTKLYEAFDSVHALGTLMPEAERHRVEIRFALRDTAFARAYLATHPRDRNNFV